MRDDCAPVGSPQQQDKSLLHASLRFWQRMAAKLPTLEGAMHLHLPQE
jgi:hypothetical protein